MADIIAHDILNFFNETLYQQKASGFDYNENKFQKRILIFTEALNSDTQKLLDGMLAACKLQLQDCLLINPNELKNSVQIIRDLQPSYIINFGTTIGDESFQLFGNLFEPFVFAGITVIRSCSLNELLSNQNQKAELWKKALQPTFTSI